ncbi:MAG: ABC transporter permease subunit, partial [Clostridia bacterium]|nr:ABC transporter permease subunit [Clostridia bacterium]
SMFILMFVGPLFMPTYDDAYTETVHQNIAPNMSMMSVPGELKNDVKMIDSYSTFSVGLSNAGKVYVWGYTILGATGIDMGDIPEEVQNAKIAYVAAGFDHIVAISEEGNVYAWGDSRLGQYGNDFAMEISTPMPEGLRNGTEKIDVANIKKVACGYQATAILMNDGSYYIWGNPNSYSNLEKFYNADRKFKDIDFTLNYVVGLNEMGTSLFTGTVGLYTNARADLTDKAVDLSSHLNGRSITGIAAASKNICLMLSDNSICFVGDFSSNVVPLGDSLKDGEYFTDVQAGTYHYTGITNLGNVYSWGSDKYNQASAPSSAKGATRILVGSYQNYLINEEDDITGKWGLRGFIFGTDRNGADIFQRIINGGRMTMTIGAVAVVISTIIGIIVGCISGYFGGKVDIFLMRVTEIFAAIPFLPFAMILSAILSQSAMSENARIFIIMCILGVLTWTGLARLVRGQVLSVRENEYVLAAKAMGVKEGRIAFKHILPNVISVILVTLTLDFAGCMLTESSLSYLGFGVNYPRPTWGNMLNAANNATVIKNFWWQWLFPALFLAITTICINIVGDTLRDVLDPKSNVEK